MKKRLKKASVLLLAFALCVSMMPAFATGAGTGEWYDGAVRYVTENALLGVKPNGGFAPDEAVSPAEFASALQKLGSTAAAPAAGALTREQAAALLYEFAVSRGIDVSVGEDTNILSYNDAFDISEGLYAAMQWACGAGLVNGTGDGNLDPAGTVTRAQAAALLHRFCTRVGSYPIAALVGTPTDYSDEGNWMFHDDSAKYAVDLFYIYPTVVNDAEKPDIVDVADVSMRQWAKLAFVKSGRPFADYTNVYAPFYRQTNLNKAMELSGSEYEAYNWQEQRTDVYAALDYYFENCNGGRPFILAGHSQGASLIKIVLSDYMRAHPNYLDRMVAAYVMGFSITKDWLADNPHVKFAEGETDTGVVISWNTEGPDSTGTNLVVHENAVSINPINWKRDETPATVAENRGTLLIDMEKMTSTLGAGIADATVNLERGTVVCTTCTEYEENVTLFGNQGLHGHDCDLYYENIRENGMMRIASYFGTLKQYEDEPAKVISHRGANAYAPENTMSAFRKAYELGADGFETDVQLTKDGELVICHNYSIDGLSDGKGLIRELTLEELKQYDFGVTYGDGTEFAGERISTLAEVLDACGDFDLLNIELKAPVERDETYITKVADTILASGVAEKVVVSGFDHNLLKELKEYAPAIKVGTLILPNLTGGLSFDIANCVPGDKVLTELTVDDITLPTDTDRDAILALGVEADSAEEVVLELCRQVGAMYTGSNWAECAEQISRQSDLTQYIDSLDFKTEYVHPYYATVILHPEVIDEMHSRGIGVNVWTANDAEVLKAVYALGVDGVITDAPDLALELLKALP